MNNRNLKVKILTDKDYEELQFDINNYIEDMDREDIIDIKYRVTVTECSAMIIYKE